MGLSPLHQHSLVSRLLALLSVFQWQKSNLVITLLFPTFLLPQLPLLIILRKTPNTLQRLSKHAISSLYQYSTIAVTVVDFRWDWKIFVFIDKILMQHTLPGIQLVSVGFYSFQLLEDPADSDWHSGQMLRSNCGNWAKGETRLDFWNGYWSFDHWWHIGLLAGKRDRWYLQNQV